MLYPLTIAVRLGAEGYSDVNMKKTTGKKRGGVHLDRSPRPVKLCWVIMNLLRTSLISRAKKF